MRDYVRNTRGRMYQSDFFEFFSKVHPVMPFMFWIPMALAVTGYTLSHELSTPLQFAVMVPAGFLCWELMEYFIHKNVFHVWPGWSGHGFHHKYPDDPNRLVMPLPVSIGLGSLIAGLLSLFGRPDFMIPLWVGIVVGYLWYDFMHWSQHYREPLTGWGKRLRAHHMAHHFGDPDRNFGISHMWMDKLLGTEMKRGEK